jgi:DNA-binding PadR family transcriptional regulator
MVNWIQRVGSVIPRGFSRYYVLNLLKDQSMTGKEIIESAINASDGLWRPSAGLVYPLLGRLLQEGLIEESDNGKYRITKKGLDMLNDIQGLENTIKKQIDVLLKVGSVGKFIATDLLERVISIASILGDNIDRMSKEERTKYKEFLTRELNRLEERERREKVDIY